MKTVNVMLGILSGIVIGATAGILMAPDKGSATRHKITSKGRKYKSMWQNKVDYLLENITAKIDCLSKDRSVSSENYKQRQTAEGQSSKSVQ